MSYVSEIIRHVRIADVLDIGIIAVLIYFGLTWIRHRMSRSVAVAIVLLALVYAAARSLDMYLTTMLFQAGLLVVVLTLVVVFQQDIRRAFERIASWRVFGGRTSSCPSFRPLDTLAESVATLAHEKIGALIVMAGREPLAKHVRGGVPVGAQITLPLLHSIFHPGSPGHDGALLIDGDRIGKLGVHLPLSKDIARIGHSGTRHAAALGLAEQCDALVLVVSEERGTISIAEFGELQRIDPGEVRPRLERFLASRFDQPPVRKMWLGVLSKDLGWKLGALLLACCLWLLLGFRVETVQRTYVIPIEYRNLLQQWVVDDPRPTWAEVTVSGPQRAFDLLDADALVISLDVSDASPGKSYVFDLQKSLRLPSELTVKEIEPRTITITVREKPQPSGQSETALQTRAPPIYLAVLELEYS